LWVTQNVVRSGEKPKKDFGRARGKEGTATSRSESDRGMNDRDERRPNGHRREREKKTQKGVDGRKKVPPWPEKTHDAHLALALWEMTKGARCSPREQSAQVE